MCWTMLVSAGSASAAAGTAAATAATAGGLTAAQTLGLVAAVGGTVMSAMGAYQQSKMAQQTAAQNARIAEYQAQDAANRGAREEQALRLKAAQVKGSQRAGLAARGLDLSSGSALDILVGTDYMLESDANTIRENTSKEQWALRNQSASYKARADAESPFLAAGGELLLGTARVADRWSTYKERTGKDIWTIGG